VTAPLSTSPYIDRNGKGYFHMGIVTGTWTLKGDVLAFRPDKPQPIIAYLANQGSPKEWIEFRTVGSNEITMFVPAVTESGRPLEDRGHVLHFKRFSVH